MTGQPWLEGRVIPVGFRFLHMGLRGTKVVNKTRQGVAQHSKIFSSECENCFNCYVCCDAGTMMQI